MTNQSSAEPVYLSYDQETLNLNYNQSAWATNADAIIAWYRSESLAAHAQLQPRTYEYGLSPFERIDVFATAESRAPVAIYVHGGAWRSLDRLDSAYAAANFISAGVNFAVLDFPSIPDARLPDMVNAVQRGIGWLTARHDELGFDSNRLIVIGHSSGAHLVAAALTAPGHDALAGRVKAILCASGAYDLEGPMLSARGNYLQLTHTEIDRFSPARHANSMSCPVAIAYGTFETDEYRRHALEFHAALEATGVPVSLTRANHQNHFEISQTLAQPDGLLFKAAMQLIA